MVLFRDFGWFQGVLIALFAVAYLLYVIRVTRIGRALNTPVYNIFFKIGLPSVIFALLLFSFLLPSYAASRKQITSCGHDMFISFYLSTSTHHLPLLPTP